jgi:hypothetical protein
MLCSQNVSFYAHAEGHAVPFGLFWQTTWNREITGALLMTVPDGGELEANVKVAD